jgi:hypothetical protein
MSTHVVELGTPHKRKAFKSASQASQLTVRAIMYRVGGRLHFYTSFPINVTDVLGITCLTPKKV